MAPAVKEVKRKANVDRIGNESRRPGNAGQVIQATRKIQEQCGYIEDRREPDGPKREDISQRT